MHSLYIDDVYNARIMVLDGTAIAARSKDQDEWRTILPHYEVEEKSDTILVTYYGPDDTQRLYRTFERAETTYSLVPTPGIRPKPDKKD